MFGRELMKWGADPVMPELARQSLRSFRQLCKNLSSLTTLSFVGTANTTLSALTIFQKVKFNGTRFQETILEATAEECRAVYEGRRTVGAGLTAGARHGQHA